LILVGRPAHQASDVSFATTSPRPQTGEQTENTYAPRADSRGIVMTPIGPLMLGGRVKNLAVTVRVTQVPRK
jgi:hypothetical protein